MAKSILVYHNQTEIMKETLALLAEDGFIVVAVSEKEKLLPMLETTEQDLILLDVMFDGNGWNEGLELIVELRRRCKIPVIVVSGQAAESTKIKALEAGADDYVTTDCNPRVLLARVKAQLRRYLQLVEAGGNTAQIYSVDNLVIDDARKEVTVDGRGVRLTPIEYKILCLLVRQSGRVFSNSQIYENIWKMKAYAADNTIAVHVRHIREKIEANPKEPKYLKVVWGSGYKVG